MLSKKRRSSSVNCVRSAAVVVARGLATCVSIFIRGSDRCLEIAALITAMHHYGAKGRDQCYSILPRKLGGGGGGFGMGVAPHCGYDDGGVLGMATPYLPPAVDSISTKNLIYMRRTRPVEFA